MIETVGTDNLDELLPLIRSYQEFYQVADISDDRNRDFFCQFGEQNPAGCQFLYREAGIAAGFATVYFTYTSTIASRVGVLNDLYTRPDYRGRGIGRALLEHCRSFALASGAARLQWLTSPDNTQAQKLYDSMAVNRSSWLFYSYS